MYIVIVIHLSLILRSIWPTQVWSSVIILGKSDGLHLQNKNFGKPAWYVMYFFPDLELWQQVFFGKLRGKFILIVCSRQSSVACSHSTIAIVLFV